MTWWSKVPKRKFIFPILSVVIFLVVANFVALAIFGPLFGKKFCTLLGALGTGIDVQLFGSEPLPKSYEIIVNSPGGTQEITCPNGGEAGEYSSKCTGTGARIADGFNYPPEAYSIIVRANGKTFTQKMDPGSCQDASNVNGAGCPPFCYHSSATIHLSP